MPGNRPGVRRTGALTRRSVRRGTRPRVAEPVPDRLRYLRSPATWLTGIVLTVAAVTFQDVLTQTVNAVLPLDRVPDRLSPQDAIEVVEVRNVKDTGTYLVRPGKESGFPEKLKSGEVMTEGSDVVDVGRSEWMITLQGRAAQQVRITDIVPEVKGGACAPPLGGSLIDAPGQGAEEVVPLYVTIDDRVPRLLAEAKREGGPREPYFTGPKAKHFTLKQNESVAFLVTAFSERGHCRWRYRVHYQVGGSPAETVLNGPDGGYFELTGELPDAGAYKEVHVPSVFACPPGTGTPGGWYTGTGEWYARGFHKGKVTACP